MNDIAVRGELGLVGLEFLPKCRIRCRLLDELQNGIHRFVFPKDIEGEPTMSHRTYFTRALAGLFAAAVSVGIAWLLAAALSPDLYARGFGSDEAMKITLGATL